MFSKEDKVVDGSVVGFDVLESSRESPMELYWAPLRVVMTGWLYYDLNLNKDPNLMNARMNYAL